MVPSTSSGRTPVWARSTKAMEMKREAAEVQRRHLGKRHDAMNRVALQSQAAKSPRSSPAAHAAARSTFGSAASPLARQHRPGGYTAPAANQAAPLDSCDSDSDDVPAWRPQGAGSIMSCDSPQLSHSAAPGMPETISDAPSIEGVQTVTSSRPTPYYAMPAASPSGPDSSAASQPAFVEEAAHSPDLPIRALPSTQGPAPAPPSPLRHSEAAPTERSAALACAPAQSASLQAAIAELHAASQHVASTGPSSQPALRITPLPDLKAVLLHLQPEGAQDELPDTITLQHDQPAAAYAAQLFSELAKALAPVQAAPTRPAPAMRSPPALPARQQLQRMPAMTPTGPSKADAPSAAAAVGPTQRVLPVSPPGTQRSLRGKQLARYRHERAGVSPQRAPATPGQSVWQEVLGT